MDRRKVKSLRPFCRLKTVFSLKILCFESWIFSKQMQKQLPCETKNFKSKSNRWSNPLFFRLLPRNPNSDKSSKLMHTLGITTHPNVKGHSLLWRLWHMPIGLGGPLKIAQKNGYPSFPLSSLLRPPLPPPPPICLSSFWGRNLKETLVKLRIQISNGFKQDN